MYNNAYQSYHSKVYNSNNLGINFDDNFNDKEIIISQKYREDLAPTSYFRT